MMISDVRKVSNASYLSVVVCVSVLSLKQDMNTHSSVKAEEMTNQGVITSCPRSLVITFCLCFFLNESINQRSYNR